MYEVIHSSKSARNLNTIVQRSGGTALHGTFGWEEFRSLLAAAFFGYALCAAILLYYGINDQILNTKGLTAKEEARGEASEIFYLYSRKVCRQSD